MQVEMQLAGKAHALAAQCQQGRAPEDVDICAHSVQPVRRGKADSLEYAEMLPVKTTEGSYRKRFTIALSG